MRRVTIVHAIEAAMTSWPKPQAWNIGAATTTVSSARHGIRSSIAERPGAAPPECLAPLGVPVVPEVSRMTLPCGRRVRMLAGVPVDQSSTVTPVRRAHPPTPRSDVGAGPSACARRRCGTPRRR